MGRTILTKVETYLVDEVRKNSVFTQTVSNKLTDTQTHQKLDFVVEQGISKSVNDITKLFSLRTFFPVKLTMTQTGVAVPPVEEPELPVYHNAQLLVNDFYIGQTLPIEVRDNDIPATVQSVRVVVFNTITGETEQIHLPKVSSGVYRGELATIYHEERGLDYDGVLRCAHNQNIRLLYSDSKNSIGQYEQISKFVRASSPYQDSTLQVNSFLYPGKPIAIMVTDADLAGNVYHSCLVRNMTTGEEETITLNETFSGVFTASVPTILQSGSFVSGDGIIEVSEGDLIRVSVTDLFAVENPTMIANCEVRPAAYTNGILSLPADATPNSNLPVTFFDYDLATQNIIDIAINNPRTGEFEYVKAHETVSGSGLFFGTLYLTSSPGVSGDDALTVAVGDVIEAVYIDINPASGPNLAVRASTSIIPLLEPEPEIPEDTEGEDSEDDEEPFVPQTVSFIVDGLFVVSGNFRGSITVSALDKPSRCELTYI